jgi:hypothetical protein
MLFFPLSYGIAFSFDASALIAFLIFFDKKEFYMLSVLLYYTVFIAFHSTIFHSIPQTKHLNWSRVCFSISDRPYFLLFTRFL